MFNLHLQQKSEKMPWFFVPELTNFGAIDQQHTVKVGTELAPETSENLHIIMRKPARENFIE
jgi:hypothetical protein